MCDTTHRTTPEDMKGKVPIVMLFVFDHFHSARTFLLYAIPFLLAVILLHLL